jgi:hypothetical protein
METIAHLLTWSYLIGTILLILALGTCIALKSWYDDKDTKRWTPKGHFINSYIAMGVIAALIWMFIFGFALLS